ncbi:MAG TPA: DUF2207 domain-containing protein [Fimbriimonadales bacterium]|nr:DUF2207 domain-containing protein [Fimbriimonadales bacterium]
MKILRVFYVFVFSVFSTCIFAQTSPYVIDDYFVEMEWRKDSSLNVRETITVTFRESRRGIFRKIPFDLPAKSGFTRRIIIEGIEVTDENGNPYTTLIRREGNYINIRIGDENKWLSPGTQKKYVISYKVWNATNWFSEATEWEPYAELYWNVIGTEWDTEITNSGFRLRFPKVEKGHRVRARLYAGSYGSVEYKEVIAVGEKSYDEKYATTFELHDNEVICRRETSLYTGEGLTVVLDLPFEYIQKPPPLKTIEFFLLPNIGLAIPLFMLVIMWALWSRFGKDPYGGPVVVQYDPPENLSGPEAGAMIDERVDRRDLAAGIISLAVKGYLDIEPEESGLLFKKRTATLILKKDEPGEDLTPFEKELFTLLHRIGKTITESDLRKEIAPKTYSLSSSLYRTLVEKNYYLKSPEKVRIAWLIGGIIVVVLLAYASFVLSPLPSAIPPIIGGVLGAIIIWFFAREMPQRTRKGAQVRQYVLGFEEFIRRARGAEFDWMSKKHPDLSLFETYLPHAIAFGLAKEWAEAFRDVLTEPPNWYRVPSGTTYNWAYLSTDLDNVSSQLATAMTTPPRSSGASGGSSGFGGGGFSGGGFGGGGGGSW